MYVFSDPRRDLWCPFSATGVSENVRRELSEVIEAFDLKERAVAGVERARRRIPRREGEANRLQRAGTGL